MWGFVLFFAACVAAQTNPLFVSHAYMAATPLTVTLSGKADGNTLVCFCNVKAAISSARVFINAVAVPVLSVRTYPTNAPTNTLVTFMTVVQNDPLSGGVRVVVSGSGAAGELHCGEFSATTGLEHHNAIGTSEAANFVSVGIQVVCPFNLLVFGGFSTVAGTRVGGALSLTHSLSHSHSLAICSLSHSLTHSLTLSLSHSHLHTQGQTPFSSAGSALPITRHLHPSPGGPLCVRHTQRRRAHSLRHECGLQLAQRRGHKRRRGSGGAVGLCRHRRGGAVESFGH